MTPEEGAPPEPTDAGTERDDRASAPLEAEAAVGGATRAEAEVSGPSGADAWRAVVAGASRRLALLLEDVRCVRCDRAGVEIEGEPAAVAALARFGPELERLVKAATGGTPRVLLGGVALEAGATPMTAPQPVVAPALGTASGGTPAARDERGGQSSLSRLRAEALQEAAANAQANTQASAGSGAATTPAAGGAPGAEASRGEGAPGGAAGHAVGQVEQSPGAGGALASPMESELVRAAIELFKARVVGPPKRVPMTPATGPGVSAAAPPAAPAERARPTSGGEGSGDE